MKTKIKFLGIALLGLLIFSTSCEKEEEIVEEILGVTFTVSVTGDDVYKSATAQGKMIGNSFVIESDKSDKEIKLYIPKFEKGTYYFDDTLNYATYTYHKEDPAKIYNSEESSAFYIKITNIHSDGVKFDGEFSFTARDANNDVKIVSGAWINVSKK